MRDDALISLTMKLATVTLPARKVLPTHQRSRSFIRGLHATAPSTRRNLATLRDTSSLLTVSDEEVQETASPVQEI